MSALQLELDACALKASGVVHTPRDLEHVRPGTCRTTDVPGRDDREAVPPVCGRTVCTPGSDVALEHVLYPGGRKGGGGGRRGFIAIDVARVLCVRVEGGHTGVRCRNAEPTETPFERQTRRRSKTRNSAIAEGPRDASCQLKSCQLPRNSAETTCTTSPEPSISCR